MPTKKPSSTSVKNPAPSVAPAARSFLGHEYLREKFEELAKRRALAHGYLFLGPWGIGKFSFAERLAGLLETGVFASKELLMDSLVIAPDEGGAIGIDAVRAIKHFLWQMPATSAYRTLIVNDAHCVTREAQNALLKVAEEPSPHSLLILVTHDPESLLPTLRSRLEDLYFAPIPVPALAAWLVREEKLAPARAETLAKNAFGKPGLALRRLHDEVFNGELASAEHFLASALAARRDIIKELAKNESFQLARFLDMLILAAVGMPALRKKNPVFFHALFETRRNEDAFNLNVKIQLEYLSSLLESR